MFKTGASLDNLTAPLIYRSGNNTRIIAEIVTNCEKSPTEFSLRWTFYENEISEATKIRVDTRTENTTIIIPEYTLPFGTIVIQINVTMTHWLFRHIYTVKEAFLKVNVSYPFVQIFGSGNGLARYGREVRSCHYEIILIAIVIHFTW